MEGNMSIEKWSMRDSMFSHAYSSSNWFKPTYFEWDFRNVSGDFVFFTDKNVFEAPHFQSIRKYAWLVESPVITPDSYNFVYSNGHIFDLIFTHSKNILRKYEHAYLMPQGGCHLDENEISCDYKKTKLVSSIYSDKRYAPGHILRHEIAQSKCGPLLDLMGSGLTGQHVKKILSCRDYMFTVAVENCREDFYFCERIVDCFLSGTIPIYWGCPSIGNFFNIDGIIIFNTVDDLFKILTEVITPELYYSKQQVIKENFIAALRYKIGEDHLYLKYKDLIR
jgi:hypothetical protein